MITFDQQTDIQSAYELWELIERGLHVHIITQFDKLLEVLCASDNPMTKGIAQRLSEAAERPIATSDPISEPKTKPPVSMQGI